MSAILEKCPLAWKWVKCVCVRPSGFSWARHSACIICLFISIPFQLFRRAGANVANIVFSWTEQKKTPHAWTVFLLPAEFLPLDSPFQRNPELSCPLILASPRLKTVTLPSSLLLHLSLLAPPWSKSPCFRSVHISRDLLRGLARCAYFECNEVSWKFIAETLVTNKPWVKMHLTLPRNRLLK